MKHLGFSLTLLMWLTIFILICNSICNPFEENREGILTCNNFSLGERDILSLTAGSGTHQRTIARCAKQGCSDLNSKLSNSTRTLQGRLLSAKLTISSMSRVTPFDMETKWECRVGPTNKITICDPLMIYARAASPACDTPRYTGTAKDEILLNCKTDRVYPKAVCSYGALLEDGTEKQLTGPVTYNHRTVTNNPVYYSTECSAAFSLSSLPRSLTAFVLKMHPPVPRIDADGITTLQIPIATPSVALHSDCPKGEVKNGYIKSGTTATCICIVSTTGFPDGHTQWYDQNGTQVGTRNDSDGSATLTIHEPPQRYSCLPEPFSGNGSAVSFSPKFGSELKELHRREKPQTILLSPDDTAVVSFNISGYPEPSKFVLRDVSGSFRTEVNRRLYSVSYTRLEPPLGRVTLNMGPGLEKGSRHYIFTVTNGFGNGIDLQFKVESASSDVPLLSDDLAIGLSVGAAAIFLAIVFFVIWACWRRHRKRDKTMTERSDDLRSQVQERRNNDYVNTSDGLYHIPGEKDPDFGYLDPTSLNKHLSSPNTNEHIYDEPEGLYNNTLDQSKPEGLYSNTRDQSAPEGLYNNI